MKRVPGTCGTFKAFNLKYFHENVHKYIARTDLGMCTYHRAIYYAFFIIDWTWPISCFSLQKYVCLRGK